jgi:hypothetical protein
MLVLLFSAGTKGVELGNFFSSLLVFLEAAGVLQDYL